MRRGISKKEAFLRSEVKFERDKVSGEESKHIQKFSETCNQVADGIEECKEPQNEWKQMAAC